MKIQRNRGPGPLNRRADLSREDSQLASVLARAAEAGARQQNVITVTPQLLQRFDSDSINLTVDFRTRLSQVYRDKFQALRALDFVPMLDSPVHQTSTGYIGEFLSKVGTAQLITELSTDVPLVSLTGRPFTGNIATYGAAGSWSQMDVFRAAVGLINLPVETQKAAREAVETMTDSLVSLGNSDAGIPGFLSHPSVETVPLSAGNWTSLSHSAVVADILTWVGGLMARVGYIESSVPDTILLPPLAKTALLAIRTTLGVSAWATVTQELREAYGITVDTWSRLASAGTGGAARVVAYRRDPKILGAIVPMVYTEFAPQERGFQVVIPAMARCGGTVVIEPKAIAYADNSLA